MVSSRTILTACLLAANLAGAQDSKTLFDFEGDFDLSKVEARSVKTSLVKKDSTALKLAFKHDQDWPGITLKAPDGKWDLSIWRELVLDVANIGSNKVTLSCRVDNPGANGRENCITETIVLEPGKKGQMQIFLPPFAFRIPEKIVGMRGTPSGNIDTKNVTQLLVFVPCPKENHTVTIDNIVVRGKVRPVSAPKEFFPFIDEMGQFIHKDWPGKTNAIDDLKKQIQIEEQQLAANPGPKDRNRYGGWATGPKRKATGFFRVEKYKNKWWFVDPEGRLFWSHGIDCVHARTSTPVSEREKYFRNLPDKKDARFGRFYGRGSWAPHGFYKGKKYTHFDFRGANLLRKYGDNWQSIFNDLVHRRLRSWGMNTIANWSDRRISLMRKTPYVGTLNVGGPVIEGSTGYWKKFHDPFDAGFRKVMVARAAEVKKLGIADDPWCIGFFIDNELSWGRDLSLGQSVLASPAKQAAKKVFVEDLKKKYGEIEKLNAKWKTSHASWDALLESTDVPKSGSAEQDILGFSARIANEYFRICREEIKKVAPNNLYFGCRFAWANDVAVRAASKYCDVISYNLYREEITDFKLPLELDMPVIVGEFHFGALDLGMFHTGLRKAKDQKHRAWKYENYVTGALKNPLIVGTHWFQFGDQATTGRGDGENYQIGFLDICDTPHQEIIEAAQNVGKNMYKLRLGK